MERWPFPLVTLILVIIGISFSLRQERHGGVMQSLGIGIVIGFSGYWIVHAFSMSSGTVGNDYHRFFSALTCQYNLHCRCSGVILSEPAHELGE